MSASASAAVRESAPGLQPGWGLIRSTLVLMGGSAAGQALLLAASPVLTRIYSPGELGLFGTYAALTAVLVVVAGLRFEAAIPLPDDDRDAFALLVTALSVGLVTALLLAVTVWLAGDLVAATLGLPGLRSWLWFLPLGVLGGVAYQSLSYWHIRKTAFPAVARTRVVQAGSAVTSQVGLGLAFAGPLGLFVGDLASRSAGSVSLARSALASMPGKAAALTVGRFRTVVSAYRRFPLIASWSSVANIAALYLPVPLFAALYGGQVAGGVFLAQRIVDLPVALVSAAAGQVFLGSAAAAVREDPRQATAFFRFAVLRLAPCAVVFACVAWVAVTVFFEPIFGEGWSQSATFARFLCISSASALVVSPVSQLVFIAGRQLQQFAGDLARLAAVTGGILCAYWLRPDDATAGVATFALVMAVSYGLFLMFYYRCAVSISRRALP